MTNTVSNVINNEVSNQFTGFKTRWGYVSYSYEDYKNLKKLHHLYNQALMNLGKFKRYNRKLPKNRTIKKILRNNLNQKIGTNIIGPMPEPKLNPFFITHIPNGILNKQKWIYEFFKIDDHQIVSEYKKARMPVNQENVLKPSFTSEQIIELLKQASIDNLTHSV